MVTKKRTMTRWLLKMAIENNANIIAKRSEWYFRNKLYHNLCSDSVVVCTSGL